MVSSPVATMGLKHSVTFQDMVAPKLETMPREAALRIG